MSIASTMTSGATRRVVSVIVSIGVSAPRKVTRQPRSLSASARYDQPEVVLLSGRGGEQSVPPRSAPPPSSERHQSCTNQVAREMLLRDGQLAALPLFPDRPQKWQYDVTKERLQAQGGNEAIDRGMGGHIVEAPRARDATRGPALRSQARHPSEPREPERAVRAHAEPPRRPRGRLRSACAWHRRDRRPRRSRGGTSPASDRVRRARTAAPTLARAQG